MKSVGGFLKNVVQRKETGLVGKIVTVGPYSVRVEAHLGDGGFAAIYRARDAATSAAFALKHMRMGGDAEALRDCYTEVCAPHSCGKCPGSDFPNSSVNKVESLQ